MVGGAWSESPDPESDEGAFLFLTAYAPQAICRSCLAQAMEREDASIARAVDALVAEGRADAALGECLNCGCRRPVVRAAAPPAQR